MSISAPFIHRPVGTTLLTLALALAGILAYFVLPVSPLPQVDFPTIQVSARLPGASPETMASAVATPLERQFGRIAGVTEMTSSSSQGSTNITLQFDLSRNIDAAARDVQAAINAAAGALPTNLPGRPTYRKTNPADAPIIILSLTSDLYGKARMYDAASSILQQKLSQVEGVGQVTVGGGALPAVRVDVNPARLNATGLGLEDVRAVLAAANVNSPKGLVEDERRAWSISATDQLLKAKQYEPLIVAFRNGAPVRLSELGDVTDSVEDIHNGGFANGKPAVSLVIFRQPNANIIDTVDRVRALMPQLRASIPAAMNLDVTMDRTTTIRASVRDVQITMCISIGLVILVVFAFLREWRSTLIPAVAVPSSLIGTFGAMYLLGYSIDNLSLMALTIATGFVVDDAIVVIENITRHLEAGMKPLEASLLGAKEIGFTVVSISVSLVAVFIPILLMPGYLGRLFREFAVTLSIAITVSMVISLTTTPMMCAVLLRSRDQQRHGRVFNVSERAFAWIHKFYEVTLAWALRHSLIMILATAGAVVLTFVLAYVSPNSLFPQQDTGRLTGTLTADQDTSAQAMQRLMLEFADVVSKDEAVYGMVGFYSGGSSSARMFVTLKPYQERKMTADQVMGRLRGKTAKLAGATLFFQSVQEFRPPGGRAGSSQYQFTLQGDNLADLNVWGPKVMEKIKTLPGIVDVDIDQKNQGREATLTYDRSTASRLGLTAAGIDGVLYDAFGQRQVSTMYAQLNQYHVVMEVQPQFSQSPEGLKYVYVKNAAGGKVPLSAFTSYAANATPLAINHQSQFPAVTISFNLLPGVSLGDAVTEVQQACRDIGLPATVHGSFAGAAQLFEQMKVSMIVLIMAALAAVYIVLGILYESLIHPITILSTLPSAGVGALVAMLVFHVDLTMIALIGIILLIGIVKKNAIMMIDFALEMERREHTSPRDAIFQACLLRFRPITMTTMAALLGGLPLAMGVGVGAELRRPLGIAIVGGLIFSQAMTLYTTPVIYLYMDRFRLWTREVFRGRPRIEAEAVAGPQAGA